MLRFEPAELAKLVRQATGTDPSSVEPMPGGASTRQYLRVAAGPRRLVAMFVPDSTPDEVTSGATSARWPFLEIQALLAERGVRVPALVAEACDVGLILLEDLGDVTLGAAIEASPAERDALYRRAVVDLAEAQRALENLPEASLVRTRSFDEKLLRWELDHYREWGRDARQQPFAAEDGSAFDAIASRLAARIASWPTGFVHRDYQSRNLMVTGGGAAPALAWIDFQDALLGPRVYDLVALLNDSYVSIDQPFIDARLDDYAAAAGMTSDGRKEIGRQFDVLTVQRKLKDAGRFIFIDRVKKNPAFLPYFEPSLAKVRRSLARLQDEDDFRALAGVLAL